MARQQQRQIAANIAAIEEHQRHLAQSQAPPPTAASSPVALKNNPIREQIRAIRNDIARDEQELAQLGHVQAETKKVANKNEATRREIAALKEVYDHDEQTLRHAVEKVDFLKKQVRHIS